MVILSSKFDRCGLVLWRVWCCGVECRVGGCVGKTKRQTVESQRGRDTKLMSELRRQGFQASIK